MSGSPLLLKHQTQQRRGLDSKMSPNICFIFMMVALPLRCPLQHGRFYLCLGLPPLPTKCIIYKANLSMKDCRQREEERELERGKNGLLREKKKT